MEKWKKAFRVWCASKKTPETMKSDGIESIIRIGLDQAAEIGFKAGYEAAEKNHVCCQSRKTQ